MGYDVTSHTDCIAALEVFRSDPQGFDLVITDMTIPAITGLALSQRMIKIRPDIPVILCTGFTEFITADKARAMGIREYIAKPFRLDELDKMLQNVLEKT